MVPGDKLEEEEDVEEDSADPNRRWGRLETMEFSIACILGEEAGGEESEGNEEEEEADDEDDEKLELGESRGINVIFL